MIILRCLHVCDNTKIDDMDKLAKIRPMLIILVAAWQAAYYSNREICLDESMIAFKDRTGAMVYQPKQPHKWGCRRGSWPIQEPHTASTSTFILASGLIMSLEFYPLLCSSIYPSVAVHVSHNGCRRSKTKPSSVKKLIICRCQQPSSVAVKNNILSLSTNIICRCQQTVQLPLVPKPIQLKQTISPKKALTRPTSFKRNYIPQLCILCCVLFVVLCIVCCVVYCLLRITALCCANNQMQLFSTKFNFFTSKHKNLFFVNY